MRFYAFNPLAGGMLSGRHSFDQAATTGRYAKGTVTGDRYRWGEISEHTVVWSSASSAVCNCCSALSETALGLE